MYTPKENKNQNEEENGAKDLSVSLHMCDSSDLIQPKLVVGQPNDPFEKEADAIADKKMRMPEQNFIRRKRSRCLEERLRLIRIMNT